MVRDFALDRADSDEKSEPSTVYSVIVRESYLLSNCSGGVESGCLATTLI